MISKEEVSRCGNLLVGSLPGGEEYLYALDVLEHWRNAHQHPMEQIELAVKDAARDISGSLYASRLKRRDTIIGKLARPGLSFDLKTLDDIAGCRCVVPTVANAHLVTSRLQEHSGYVKYKDYITSPKPDGYRGIHLFHRCDSPEYGYSKMRVEVQVRTQCQHAWATAVETFDLLNASGLKFGLGSKESTREFALISGLFALYENCNPVPGIPSSRSAVLEELSLLERDTKIIPRLKGFSQSVSAIQKNADSVLPRYYLLEFNYVDQLVKVSAFGESERVAAAAEYSSKERAKQDEADVLLVKAETVDALKALYPNYFSDITYFIELLSKIIEENTFA